MLFDDVRRSSCFCLFCLIEQLLGLEAVLRHAGSNHPATPAHETPAGRENGAREDEAGAIRESEIVDTSSSPAEDMRALSLDCGETHAGSLFSSEALLGGAEGDASSAEHGSEQSSPTIEDARSGILLLDHDGVSPQQNSSADVPSSSGGGRVALSSPCNDSLVALLRRAATRISLLLELLGSAGEEDSWAVLVGGNEHSACKRLADYAACGSRFFMDPVGVLNDESCDSDRCAGGVEFCRRCCDDCCTGPAMFRCCLHVLCPSVCCFLNL